MKYYATINPTPHDATNPSNTTSSKPRHSRDADEPIAWLSAEHIEEEGEESVDEPEGVEGMLEGSAVVGGIVTETVDGGKRVRVIAYNIAHYHVWLNCS